MNIVFFTHYTSLYGANRSLINLADGLRSKGFNVFLVAPAQGPITEYFNAKQYPFFIHPLQPFLQKEKPQKVNVLLRLEHLIENLHILIKHLKGWSIDIVYTNSSVIDIGIICSKAINRPHIWHIREFGDLDYGVYPDVGKHVFQKLLCASDGLIFISNALKNYILPSNNHKNLKIIYNGVATFKFIQEIYANSKKISKSYINTFSIAGLVTQKKGQHVAISSFINVLKVHPKTKLFIAGEGDLLLELKKIVYENKLYENIIFLGNIVDPLGLFMNSDVALMCSDYEAMGRVTVEAMSCLCPVIGTNSGANPEIIDHGTTGYLYNNPDELSHFMIETIENPAMTRQMGIKAWETARDNYSIERYTDNIISVIDSAKYCMNFDKKSLVKEDFDKNLQVVNEPYLSIYKKFIDL